MADVGRESLPIGIEKVVINVPESEQASLKDQIANNLSSVGDPRIKALAQSSGYFIGVLLPFIGSIGAPFVLRNLAAADSEIITGVLPKIVFAGSLAFLSLRGTYASVANYHKVGKIGASVLSNLTEKTTKYFDGRKRQADVEDWLRSERIIK